jgi:hypothetical protein
VVKNTDVVECGSAVPSRNAQATGALPKVNTSREDLWATQNYEQDTKTASRAFGRE